MTPIACCMLHGVLLSKNFDDVLVGEYGFVVGQPYNVST